eukprot:COSAG02_NODE_4289_length_5540_cov_40.610101_3_plen_81_part_00
MHYLLGTRVSVRVRASAGRARATLVRGVLDLVRLYTFGGSAAALCYTATRELGYVGKEVALPYQRTPSSKTAQDGAVCLD